MKHKNSYVLILFLGLLGCRNEKSSIRPGRHINMPSKIEIFSQTINDEGQEIQTNLVLSGANLLVVYLRADCPSCYSAIENWSKKAEELYNEELSFIIILGANDNFELLKWVAEREKLDIPFPVVLDINDDFLTLNSFKVEFVDPFVIDRTFRVVNWDLNSFMER